MSLIQCPECGQRISDKSTICVHCGFPISKYANDSLYDIVIKNIKGDGEELTINKRETFKTLTSFYHIDYRTCGNIINDLPQTIVKGLNKESAIFVLDQLSKTGCICEMIKSSECKENLINNKIFKEVANNDMLICPRCFSTSVSTNKRGFSFLTGFIGANKTVNRCGNCGWTWQP